MNTGWAYLAADFTSVDLTQGGSLLTCAEPDMKPLKALLMSAEATQPCKRKRPQWGWEKSPILSLTEATCKPCGLNRCEKAHLEATVWSGGEGKFTDLIICRLFYRWGFRKRNPHRWKDPTCSAIVEVRLWTYHKFPNMMYGTDAGELGSIPGTLSLPSSDEQGKEYREVLFTGLFYSYGRDTCSVGVSICKPLISCLVTFLYFSVLPLPLRIPYAYFFRFKSEVSLPILTEKQNHQYA